MPKFNVGDKVLFTSESIWYEGNEGQVMTIACMPDVDGDYLVKGGISDYRISGMFEGEENLTKAP
jgi:hypothetical protein